MARRNRTQTIRLTLSLDPTTDKVLEDLATIGPFGKNKAQVASMILSQWIWDNEEKLSRNGVKLVRSSKSKATVKKG